MFGIVFASSIYSIVSKTAIFVASTLYHSTQHALTISNLPTLYHYRNVPKKLIDYTTHNTHTDINQQTNINTKTTK